MVDSKNQTTRFQQVASKLKNLYTAIGNFSFAPLNFSIDLINSNSVGYGGSNPAAAGILYGLDAIAQTLGWVSLPLTAAANVITLPVSLVGLLGVSLAAPVTLGLAKLADLNNQVETIPQTPMSQESQLPVPIQNTEPKIETTKMIMQQLNTLVDVNKKISQSNINSLTSKELIEQHLQKNANAKANVINFTNQAQVETEMEQVNRNGLSI